MIKRELKVNFKNFIIWTFILVGIFLVVFLVYPSITSGNNMKDIDDMMEMFPEELLQAFNMDITSIDSAFGWLKSEGFSFVLLIIGMYSGILGSNILLKEESDKTIEYLNSLPIKRNNIVASRIVVGVIYIIAMTGILGIFNYIGLVLSGDFDKKMYFLLSITPIFTSIVIFSLCMFISTFTHKAKNTLGISVGIVFLSYMLQMLSGMDKSTEFLKYLSIYTLADTRNVILNTKISFGVIIISLGLTALMFALTNVRYNKKELM